MTFKIDRRQFVPSSERNEQIAIYTSESAPRNDHAAVRRACKCSNGFFGLAEVALQLELALFPAMPRLIALHRIGRGSGDGRFTNNRDSRDRRRELLEDFQPLRNSRVFEWCKSGSVATGTRQAFYEARTNRIRHIHEHNGDGASCLQQGPHGGAAGA